MLRVGILKEDSNEPTFSHISKVDLSNHIEYRDAKSETEEAHNTEAANLAAWQHDQLFADVATRPPWKVTVLKPKEGVFSKSHVDILFAYHHAIMDGTGGKEFHQHLVTALQAATPVKTPSTELSFPEAPALPEAEDDAVGFKNSYSFMAAALWKMAKPGFLSSPPAWAGKPISLEMPHITRALPVDFSPEILGSLIKGAREHSTTLTGLLQALILTSFSSRVEEAKSLQCTTPINLRPYMLSSVNKELQTKMHCEVTSLTSDHSAAVVSKLRNPNDELIWSSARRIKEELVKRIAQLPNDDICGLIPLIKDLQDYFRKKEGTPRETLWEVSNLGVFKQQKSDEGWQVTRFMFSSSPMVAGAGVGFNTASVDGLTITITWQEGVLEDELLKGVAADLLKWTKRWHEEGKFV